MDQSVEMVKIAYRAIDDKKGRNITVIDISGITTIADYFIIADGDSTRQVQAISDNLEEALGRAGYFCSDKEGYSAAKWILLDYKDVVVHIFSKDDRQFYDLERIWRDGRFVSKEELI